VIDDAVRRGRMTRGDADEMLGRLVTRGRDQADDLVGQLERLLSQVREAPGRARQGVESRAQKARKRAVKAADKPLAGADKVRRAARVPGFPITAYDDLSGVHQLKRERRVENVGRGEPVVQPAPLVSYRARDDVDEGRDIGPVVLPPSTASTVKEAFSRQAFAASSGTTPSAAQALVVRARPPATSSIALWVQTAPISSRV
jgi:hypothetical protein